MTDYTEEQQDFIDNNPANGTYILDHCYGDVDKAESMVESYIDSYYSQFGMVKRFVDIPDHLRAYVDVDALYRDYVEADHTVIFAHGEYHLFED